MTGDLVLTRDSGEQKNKSDSSVRHFVGVVPPGDNCDARVTGEQLDVLAHVLAVRIPLP